jgi:hypothetical protein
MIIEKGDLSMIDMNVVYELIAEAKKKGIAKRLNYFGLSYYAIDHYDHTSVRVFEAGTTCEVYSNKF